MSSDANTIEIISNNVLYQGKSFNYEQFTAALRNFRAGESKFEDLLNTSSLTDHTILPDDSSLKEEKLKRKLTESLTGIYYEDQLKKKLDEINSNSSDGQLIDLGNLPKTIQRGADNQTGFNSSVQSDPKKTESSSTSTTDQRLDPQTQKEATSSSSGIDLRDQDKKIKKYENELYTYSIYDATSYLLQDRDGDGYHSKFKIEFDADVTDGLTKTVYAKLYIRQGTGTYNLYYTTPNFSITGTNVDWYWVETTLNTNYPTGLYDIRIDLFETGSSTVKASKGPEDSDLDNLRLEDLTPDTNGVTYSISIDAARSYLLQDLDGDTYHSRFKIEIDASVSGGLTINASAKIYIRRGTDTYNLVYEQNNLMISGTSTTLLQVYFTLQTDNPTDLYDIRIDMFGTGGVTASVGPNEDPDLDNLKLEDLTQDHLQAVYSIYEANSYLLQDLDGDTYHSKFRIDFDADVTEGLTKSVYAKLYIRQGTGTYNLYHTTPNFPITGAAAERYWVETTLNTNYPTGLYDIRIDLFEASGTVVKASRGPEDPDLGNLKLEDRTQDVTNYTLNLSKTGTGTGGVKVNGTLQLLPYSASFPSGSNVTLEAVPDANYTFTGWSGALSGTVNPTSITMNSNNNVGAGFAGPGIQPIWQTEITLTDAGNNNRAITMGQHQNATNGIDPALGEVELPPTPSAGVMDARFILPVTPAVASIKDFRGESTGMIVWTFTFQPGAGYPINLSWNPALLRDGSYRLKDVITGNIVNVDMKGQNSYSVTNSGITSLKVEYTKEITAVEYIEGTEEQPLKYELTQNYPNPFNPSTTIGYSISEKNNVSLVIYNQAGETIDVLVSEVQEAGRYNLVWNADKYSSGVYFCELKAGQFRSVRKLMLIK
ncbi:MAG: choice-of-anchor H family protein [Ignavibacteriaceae bacterium]|nr:choice-of-anchor H family protein [Ignavibacteriaceae bacterium]